jgi:Kef-type K+ transport system membrane component KefB
MSFLTGLFILSISAYGLGRVMERFGQPPLVGEILAGMLLGPSCLQWIQPSPAFSTLSELAVFFIVLSAGLDMNFNKVSTAFREAGLPISILAFFIPFVSGLILGDWFHFEPLQIIFLGICISITALPVAVRILKNLGLLEHPIAEFSVAAAITNDIVAFLILGVVLDLSVKGTAHSAMSTAWISVIKLVLLMGIVFLARWGIQKLKSHSKFLALITRWFKEPGRETMFCVPIILWALAFAALAESLGFPAAIGAFFGALLLDPETIGPSLKKGTEPIHAITGGFLAPLFFAFLGLEFHPQALASYGLVLSLILTAVLSKILGGFLGGKLGGLSSTEALGIGIILNARGIMELVVAGIGLNRGLIGPDLFSMLVIMGIVTTVLTPFLFRQFVNLKK